MLELCVEIFKNCLTLVGIICVVSIGISIVTEPFKKAKRKKNTKLVLEELNNLANQCVEELKKQEELKKTNSKNIKKTNKKEEK